MFVFISDHDLSELRSRADIVQVIGEKVPLKKAGRHFKGLCPFHQEKTSSFMVQPEKQIYHCFGCGVGGDIFSFVMKYENVSFPEAIERLADRYGVELKSREGEKGDFQKIREEKELSYRINRLAARYFLEKLLHPESGKKARAYLAERGIREENFRSAPLGYAPEGRGLVTLLKEKNAPMALAEKLGLVRKKDGDLYDFFRDRVLFTILSTEEKVLGFSGRALGEAQPKYLNSPESVVYHKSDSLLGIHRARASIREKDQAILVEGNFDMLRLHQEGILNVVAPLGTALTPQQIKILSRITDRFILLFDGDAAGMKAAERALEIFLPFNISPRVILLPQNEDPDSFVRKNGREAMEQKIRQAPLLIDVRLDLILSQGTSNPQAKAQAIKQARDLIQLFPGDVEKRVYGQRIADRFGIPEDLLLKVSNFSTRRSEEEGAVKVESKAGSFPMIEKKLLELFLSGSKMASGLSLKIESRDFSYPLFGRIWAMVRHDFEAHGDIQISRLLSVASSDAEKGLLTELAMAGGEYGEMDAPAAEDCVKQLRKTRLQGELKNLSQKIRRAETQNDQEDLKNLLIEKNKLMKELRIYH